MWNSEYMKGGEYRVLENLAFQYPVKNYINQSNHMFGGEI
jgi:hypothetical protein